MTALLMMESHIGTMGSLLYFVLALRRCVGHPRALLFHPGVGYRVLLTCLGCSGTRRQKLSVTPPGRPAEREKEEYAPGVLGRVAVGVMFFDEVALARRQLELRLEALSKEW